MRVREGQLIWKDKNDGCGSEREVPISTFDPCGECGKKAMANLMLSTKCENWIHGRCAKRKSVIPVWQKSVQDSKNKIEERVEPAVKLCD